MFYRVDCGGEQKLRKAEGIAESIMTSIEKHRSPVHIKDLLLSAKELSEMQDGPKVLPAASACCWSHAFDAEFLPPCKETLSIAVDLVCLSTLPLSLNLSA